MALGNTLHIISLLFNSLLYSESVSDVKLNALAAHIPPDKYHDLSEELGIECNVTPFTLQNHGGNNKQEMRERLFAWKNKTGGSFTELKRICNSVFLGGIWYNM